MNKPIEFNTLFRLVTEGGELIPSDYKVEISSFEHFPPYTKVFTLITHERCPSNLFLDARFVSREYFEMIIRALKTGRCPQGLSISLRHYYLQLRDIQEIAAVLAAGVCKAGLTLDLNDNEIAFSGIQAIANALQSGQCPPRLSLSLNFIQPMWMEMIANALSSGRAPQGLQLDFRKHATSPVGVLALTNALKTEKCPQGLSLVFNQNSLGPTSLELIAQALSSGSCPIGLSLDFSDDSYCQDSSLKINPIEILAIANALGSGSCPPGLSINFGINIYDCDIRRNSIIAIINALGTGRCPPKLSIKFGMELYPGVDALLALLASGEFPKDLRLDITSCMERPMNLMRTIAETLLSSPKIRPPISIQINTENANANRIVQNAIEQINHGGFVPFHQSQMYGRQAIHSEQFIEHHVLKKTFEVGKAQIEYDQFLSQDIAKRRHLLEHPPRETHCPKCKLPFLPGPQRARHAVLPCLHPICLDCLNTLISDAYNMAINVPVQKIRHVTCPTCNGAIFARVPA